VQNCTKIDKRYAKKKQKKQQKFAKTHTENLSNIAQKIDKKTAKQH